MSQGARRELWLIRSLLPLISCDLGAQWSSKVLASDASSTGLGVCERDLDAKIVGSIGRCKEKWRFETEEAILSRRSALGVAPDVSLNEFLNT